MTYTRWLTVLGLLIVIQGCSLSDHKVVPSQLGTRSSLAELEKVIDVPVPIEIQTINSAD